MASEYLKMKARQQAQPEPPPAPMTRKQKLQNWFHYHWLWLVVGGVLIWIVGSMLWNVLGIGQVKPDCILAYVGTDPLPEGAAARLEVALAELCTDENGDGRVKVELRQYVTSGSGDAETALYYNYAASATLVADITKGESGLFLTSDPKGLQLAYQIYADPAGNPPAEEDYEVADKVYAWNACPRLKALEVDQAVVSGLYIGRRCFYEEIPAEQRAAIDNLWKAITEGASR